MGVLVRALIAAIYYVANFLDLMTSCEWTNDIQCSVVGGNIVVHLVPPQHQCTPTPPFHLSAPHHAAFIPFVPF